MGVFASLGRPDEDELVAQVGQELSSTDDATYVAIDRRLASNGQGRCLAHVSRNVLMIL